MVYACAMEQTRYFNIEADSDDQVIDWLAAHNFQDVDNLTKDYMDEYSDRICGYGDKDPEMKAHFDIRKEKETVTDKMERLKALINESNKIMDDVKAETKRLEEEYLENKKEQYKELCETLKPYFELVKELGNPDNFMQVSSKYEIRFENPSLSIGVQEAIHDGTNHWIGRFDIRDNYYSSKNRMTRENYITYDKTYSLDDFMDTFDEDMLQDNFAAMVTEQLSKLAKETDDRYQNAKSKLERDNQDQ